MLRIQTTFRVTCVMSNLIDHMNPLFDSLIDRRATDCEKWSHYAGDVLPLWVADMDFRSPEPVVRALRERVEHSVFGYACVPPELVEVIVERMARLYRWTITPEQIVFLPGIVVGLNVACRAFARPGEAVVVQTPVYAPFLSAPVNNDLVLQSAPLAATSTGRTLRYEMDLDAFEDALTPATRLFILCHPHNPVGREWEPEVLRRLAGVCERHHLVICSDEIHCDLMLDGRAHVPFAALAPEIAQRTVTFMAPSKTFNLPGLHLGFAIIPDSELRRQFRRAAEGFLPLISALGAVAALAAYRDGGEWLEQLRAYLTANRDALLEYLAARLPTLRATVPEATYLAWIDCRALELGENPYRFFLDKGRVAFNDGSQFGSGGQDFIRLNFGCPRLRLIDALDRMSWAVESI